MTSGRVLVTGSSGYIGLHIVDQLLKEKHRVRGTVQNIENPLETGPLKRLGDVELVQADLVDAQCWRKACDNVETVIHLASPLPIDHFMDEESVVRPALEGLLNVLNAALDAGVKRVVVTSSGVTLYDYDVVESKTYTEDDWVAIEHASSAYQKSKIRAERTAWDFVAQRKARNEPCFELVTVLPAFVLGPALSAAKGASVLQFLSLFDTSRDKLTNIYATFCDVRDVARAHVVAAFSPNCAGQRVFISGPNFLSLKECAMILKKTGHYRVVETFDEPEGAKRKFDTAKVDNNRMRNLLGIEPIDFEKTLLDMAQSLIEFGLINPVDQAQSLTS